MDIAIIQIPVAKTIRDDMVEFVEGLGLASIQDYVRMIFKKSLNGEMGVYVGPKPVVLSAKNVMVYDKLVEDIEKGKESVYESKNVNDLLDQLYGRKNPVLKKVSKKL